MSNFSFKTDPYKHQADAFDTSKDRKDFAYLMEMGTGKSKIGLDVAGYMYSRGWINAVAIFANKGSYANWKTDEIPTHLSDEINRSIALWRAGAGKKEMKVFRETFTVQGDLLRILVMNIEALAYERSYRVADTFLKRFSCLMIVDESTTIKNPKAKRTKGAVKLGKLAKARRIMTGSPITNSPLDLYSQFDFLKRGILGFTSYYTFRSHFADLVDMQTKQRTFKKVVGYKNLNELTNRISVHSFIVKKKDCLDLPPKVYQKVSVDMSPEQVKYYKQLSKDAVAFLEESTVTTKVILTKLLRLHQLVCGHLTDDDGVVHEIKNNRISALQSILDECSRPVVIWANYRADIQAIERHLAEEYGQETVLTYYGDTSDEDRDRAKRILKRGADPEGVQFLVGNTQTGGYGLTLTSANIHIYYSNNFSLEKRAQSEDRSHRIGQDDKVTYIDLYCPGTIDEKIMKSLRNKKELADLITVSNWRELFK